MGRADGERRPTVWRCPRCAGEIAAYIAVTAVICSRGVRTVSDGGKRTRREKVGVARHAA